MSKKMNSYVGMVLATTLLFSSVGCSKHESAPVAWSSTAKPAEDSMPAEYPKTPAEYERTAKICREKAAEYRLEAERHRRMKALYSTRTNHMPSQMDKHCDRLVKVFGELAEEFDQFVAWQQQQLKAGSK